MTDIELYEQFEAAVMQLAISDKPLRERLELVLHERIGALIAVICQKPSPNGAEWLANQFTHDGDYGRTLRRLSIDSANVWHGISSISPASCTRLRTKGNLTNRRNGTLDALLS